MNSVLQCFLAIDDLKNYYMNEQYTEYNKVKTVSNRQDYSSKFADFYQDVSKFQSTKKRYLNPKGIKSLVTSKFSSN